VVFWLDRGGERLPRADTNKKGVRSAEVAVWGGGGSGRTRRESTLGKDGNKFGRSGKKEEAPWVDV